MATFQEFHGISLAANSWIENLFVEQLASDPVPVGPGRVWFNTTEKKFKQSTLDGGGGVIVRTFATVEDVAASLSGLQSAIDAEVTARTAADTTLQNNINAEATARAAADTTLQGNINAEATARAAADTTLTNAINAEVTARQAADQALQNQISALGSAFNYVGTLTGGAAAGSALDLETLPADQKNAGDYFKVTTAGYFKVGAGGTPFYANLGDGLVWNLNAGVDIIDNTNAAVQGTATEIAVTGSVDTGFTVALDSAFKTRVSTLETDLAAEVTNRSAADTTLQNNINAEVTARQAADTTLQGNIDAEATARAAADLVLQGNIDAEVTARQAADLTLTNAINAEVTARTAADTAITNQIGTLSSLTTTEKGTLVGAINEVKSLAGDGVTAFKTQINNARYTETTSTAATSHTINHALGSTIVDVCVWIDRGDSIWRNDMAAVSIIDANNVKVDLTAARNIRITVEKMEDFA